MLLTKNLKDRELDILRLMAHGLTNSQIANQLYLARETVRWYNKQIYSKLGVRNRTHAVTRAQELGLLEHSGAIEETAIMPPIQYVKSDDAYIAYQVVGDGPIDMLYVGSFLTHLECSWEQARCVWAYRRLSSMARLILVDSRGFGLSDRVTENPTPEQCAQDLNAVLDAVGSEKAVLLASCEGAPAASLAAVNYPERIEGLILLNAIVKGSRSDDFPWAMPFKVYDYIFENVRQSWGGPYAIEYFAPDADAEFKQWWAKFLRLAASPGTALEAVGMMRDIDLSAVLPQIDVPTLVMHSRQNQLVRVEAGRYTADHIPDARYVELPGNAHLWWWDAAPYLNEIEAFLDNLYDCL